MHGANMKKVDLSLRRSVVNFTPGPLYLLPSTTQMHIGSLEPVCIIGAEENLLPCRSQKLEAKIKKKKNTFT